MLVRTTERQRQALDLRLRGWTQTEIAQDLGVTQQSVFNLLNQAMKNARGESAEMVAELRNTEMMRLDQVQRRLMNLVDRAERLMKQADEENARIEKVNARLAPGEEKISFMSLGGEQLMLQTVDRLLKLSERRAKIGGLERATVEGAENDPWVGVIQTIMERATSAFEAGGTRAVPSQLSAGAIPTTIVSEGSQPGNGTGRRRNKRKGDSSSGDRPDHE